MSNRTLALLMGVVVFLIAAVGVVFIVALAGGSDDSSSPTKSSSGGDICKGNTLITYGIDPLTVLDPIQVRDDVTSTYAVEIFGGLVTLGLDLSVQPDIASKWDVSGDGTTYTFHLRSDAVFQNGRKVTAQDFKYSLERAADPKNASPTVTLYLGNIAGLKDRFNNKATEVSGVRVVDDATLEIKLIQPSDYFLAELTYPVAFVVDKSQLESDRTNWTRHPNGTGPFKLAELTPGDRLRLTRNDRYHLGPAKLDGVTFELGGASLTTRYANNELHVGGVAPIDLADVKNGKSSLSPDYHAEPSLTIAYLAFNVRQAPFDDPKVRQAMSMAIDLANINTVLLYDSQRVADGIIPPGMPGYQESIHALGFNATGAKQLLDSSKYAGNVPRIVLTYGGAAGDSPGILAAYQKAWKDVLGIQVDLQAQDPAGYLRDLRTGAFQMFAGGWVADYPDPEDFIDKLYASDSPQNNQGYKDEAVDSLIFQARAERDRTKRFALLNQAEQKILDDAVVIPTFWPVSHILVKPCVKNWPQVPFTLPKYRYISIEADTK